MLQGTIILEQFKKLFNSYIREMAEFITRLYKPEYMVEDMRGSLPELYGFILYMEEGLNASEAGDIKRYLSSLRKAISVYSPMKTCVKKLIQEIEDQVNKQTKKQTEEQDAAKSEFEQYGNKVKELIRTLILQGNLATAKEAVMAYEKVNPADPEMGKLKEAAGIYLS